MTQEDKELLLRDLCARLPYGVKFQGEDSNVYTLDAANYFALQVEDVVFKPYLRPMSNMTEEEEVLFRCELPAIAKTDAQLVAMRMELFLKGHLDFNHLIEKGLALEALPEMYKTE